MYVNMQLFDAEFSDLLLSIGHSVAVCIILVCLLKFFHIFLLLMAIDVGYEMYQYQQNSQENISDIDNEYCVIPRSTSIVQADRIMDQLF